MSSRCQHSSYEDQNRHFHQLNTHTHTHKHTHTHTQTHTHRVMKSGLRYHWGEAEEKQSVRKDLERGSYNVKQTESYTRKDQGTLFDRIRCVPSGVIGIGKPEEI